MPKGMLVRMPGLLRLKLNNKLSKKENSNGRSQPAVCCLRQRQLFARAVLVAQHPPEELGHGDVKGLIKLD